MQDYERTGGAAGFGLSEALGGPVERGERPAEAGREVGEDSGRSNLEMDRRPSAGAAGPELQRAGPAQALSDRPAGVPGPAGPRAAMWPGRSWR